MLSGKYEVGERLGGGGMADVYEGRLVGSEGFSRPVAIKFIREHLTADSDFSAMLIREAKTASLLNHPNIVSVLDFDRTEDGRFFLVMELVQGANLRELLRLCPCLPTSAIVYLIGELLHALAHVHSVAKNLGTKAIVHRDLSPDNVMISSDAAVKLADFGLAKRVDGTDLTRVGTIKGKYAYMSPEQRYGEALDQRSDLFALGIIFWELLAGERLFCHPSDDTARILKRVVQDEILPPDMLNPDCPPELARLSMQLLERDVTARCPSPAAALRILAPFERDAFQGRREVRRLMAEYFGGDRVESVSIPSTIPYSDASAPLSSFSPEAYSVKIGAVDARSSTSSSASLSGSGAQSPSASDLCMPSSSSVVDARPARAWSIAGMVFIAVLGAAFSGVVGAYLFDVSRAVPATQSVASAVPPPTVQPEAPPTEPTAAPAPRAASTSKRSRKRDSKNRASKPVSLARIEVTGALSHAAASAALRPFRVTMARCMRTSGAEAAVVLFVTPEGRVRSVHAPGAVRSCVREALAGARFPSVRGRVVSVVKARFGRT